MRTVASIFCACVTVCSAHPAMAGWYLDSLANAPLIEIRGETADTAQKGADKYVQDNLDYILANHEWVIVNFCAYWCGDCNNFKPDFLKASKKRDYKSIRWAIADVDGVRGNENFRQRFNLPGTPTVILFHKGEIARSSDGSSAILDGSEGDKTYDDLLALLKSHYR